MWAVYLCGPTDCFLHALFRSEWDAQEWARQQDRQRPEKCLIKFFPAPADIDTTDTGWSPP